MVMLNPRDRVLYVINVIGDVACVQVCLIVTDIVHLAIAGIRGVSVRHRAL